MKTKLITTLILLAAQLVFAADTPLFEIHAVLKTPSPTSKEYSLPERDNITEKVHLDPTVLLDAKAIKSAVVESSYDNSPSIRIQLTDVGAKQFAELTTTHLKRRLGFIIAGKLLSAPVIQDIILGGSLQIAGRLTQQEAANLATMLNAEKPQ